MYAIYGNIYHQYTPNVSIYIPYMDPMGTRKDPEPKKTWISFSNVLNQRDRETPSNGNASRNSQLRSHYGDLNSSSTLAGETKTWQD